MRRSLWEFGCPLLILVASVCCVSQVFYEQRFRESESLTPPTVTAPADPDHFTFAAVGDLHIGNDTSRFRAILAAAQAEGDSFLIGLGDNVDKGEEEQYAGFQQAVTDLSWTNKIIPVIGNHEIFDGGWTHYKTYFGPSHYKLQVGNTLFLVLDTADSLAGGEAVQWLKDRLGEPRPTNTIILTHYLPTVPGVGTYLKLSNDLEVATLMKIARDGGVKAWLGGHHHSFAQGEIEGVTYLLAGGGGGRLMEPVKEHFFVQVRVDGDQLFFERRKVN